MPSARYSASESPPAVSNGSTAIAGQADVAGRLGTDWPGTSTKNAWIGYGMFLTYCSPMSSSAGVEPSWSRTDSEMQIPPGRASRSRRAAMLMPEP
jgi:hypothetical protein